MASTNKTDNLNLSQFIDTDKPAWLTDYNVDMQKIDESIMKVSNYDAENGNRQVAFKEYPDELKTVDKSVPGAINELLGAFGEDGWFVGAATLASGISGEVQVWYNPATKRLDIAGYVSKTTDIAQFSVLCTLPIEVMRPTAEKIFRNTAWVEGSTVTSRIPSDLTLASTGTLSIRSTISGARSIGLSASVNCIGW